MDSLFVIIAAIISLFRFPPFQKYRVFGWSIIFTLSIFVYFKAKGYYAIGIYPIYLAFGAVYLENLFQEGWKRYLKPIAILFIVVFFIPFYKIAFPVSSPEYTQQNSGQLKSFGLLRWEDGRDHQLPQDYADMLGWRELAEKTDNAYKSLSDKNHTLILCDNYGQAGAINYYSRQDIHAVSLNADYINWFVLDSAILHVVLIKENVDDLSREKNLFDSVTLSGKVESKFSREHGTGIFVLSSPKVNINELLRQEIKKRKLY